MTTTLEPRVRSFTSCEYHQMADIGLFEGQRVELIDGEIIQMSPQNYPHASTISKLIDWLAPLLHGRYTLRCQARLVVSDKMEPEPDIAIIDGPPDAQTQHPRTALLIIEVADTTLRHDRAKAAVYAGVGVKEYWIINLVDRKLEVYRDPVAAAGEAGQSGARHEHVTIYSLDQTVQAAALALPAKRVGDLFPAA